MLLMLSIALLVLGTIGTLAAFGGETWTKGPERIDKRITRRGWVSLASLSLAFCAGVSKEVISTRDRRIAEREASASADEANRWRAAQESAQRRLDQAIAMIADKTAENARLSETINQLTRAKEFAISEKESIPITIPIAKDNPAKITLLEYDGPITVYVDSTSGATKTYTALPSESPKTYVFRWEDTSIVSAVNEDVYTQDVPLDKFGRRTNRFGLDEDKLAPPIVNFDNLDGHRDVTLHYVAIRLGATRHVRGKYLLNVEY